MIWVPSLAMDFSLGILASQHLNLTSKNDENLESESAREREREIAKVIIGEDTPHHHHTTLASLGAMAGLTRWRGRRGGLWSGRELAERRARERER